MLPFVLPVYVQPMSSGQQSVPRQCELTGVCLHITQVAAAAESGGGALLTLRLGRAPLSC